VTTDAIDRDDLQRKYTNSVAAFPDVDSRVVILRMNT